MKNDGLFKYLAFFLFFSFQLSSLLGQQSPEIMWDKTYGGSEFDNAQSIQTTSDGGYIVAGNTKSDDGDISDGNNGSFDYWIIKLDASGNKVWDKTYGGSGDDYARSIQQTSDRGYIVSGYTMSDDEDISDGNNGSYDYWIIKLDASGNKVWDKTYGGSGDDYARSIQQTSDGGYIVSGYTMSDDGDISDGNNGDDDFWIIKLDSYGNIVWDKTYGGSDNDYAKSIQQTSDGGYIVSGNTSSDDGDVGDGNNGSYDYWIIKLDASGNKVWDKTYGGSKVDYAQSIQQTSDGGYIVAGFTGSNDGDISDGNNGSYDFWIIKLDSSGNKVWDKTYGGSSSDDACSIQQTSDGDYIVAVHTWSDDGDISDGNNGDDDFWIIKLDSSGNKVWDKTFGGSSLDIVTSIQQTSDGVYIVSGYTKGDDGDISDGNNGQSDYWIIKLQDETPQSTNQIKQKKTFKIYPNPANSQIVIGFDLIQTMEEVLITDMTGKIVKQFQTQKSTTEIDISTLENGVYFVKAGGVSQKLVKK